MEEPRLLQLPFVSTGHLPPTSQARSIVEAVYERVRSNTEGALSTVYPALANADAEAFGVSLVSTTGISIDIGDVDALFPIMSVVKPFTFALMAEVHGAGTVRDYIGVNATGMPFNSLEAIERSKEGRTNPMVNSGAIATTSLAPGDTLEERWRFLHDGLSAFAGRELQVMEDIYTSASASNFCNRAIVDSLEERGRLQGSAADALDLYTRACSLAVSARDLAMMGATLACGGMQPETNRQVVSPRVCHYTLVVMVTAGMYETSGDWLYDTGLPGKSGIGGGIVTVAPGKGGMGTYAPLLDPFGNSVKGQIVAAELSRELGMDLFISRPSE